MGANGFPIPSTLLIFEAMSPPPQHYAQRRPLGHGCIAPGSHPARPRDAATLVLYRQAARGPEVLMGRRSRQARFVPDFFVFPGGRVDRGDFAARPASRLASEAAARMGVGGRRATAEALAKAALRETYEETGLLLAQRGAVGAEAQAGWAPWRERGAAPDLARLAYIGRAITSRLSPIRFHARFFLAEARDSDGALGGSGELSELAWYPVEEALRRLPVVDVTEFMLSQLLRRHRERAYRPPGTPLFAYRGEKLFVRWDK